MSGGAALAAGPALAVGPALALGPALISTMLFIFIFGGGPLAAKLLQQVRTCSGNKCC